MVLRGDGDLVGRGATWHLAMENLESSAVGAPFFGTTANVVLGDSGLLPNLLAEARLRPAASVYFGDGVPEELALYFQGKSGEITIQTLKTRELDGGYIRIPTIMEAEGGYEIAG